MKIEEERFILLVEDDAAVARALARGIGKDAVRHVGLLADALDAVKTPGCEAVVVDLRLPDGNGIDLVRRLRADRHELPVVIVSGHIDAETSMEALRLGARTLVKPASAADVGRVILRAVEERRHRLARVQRAVTMFALRYGLTPEETRVVRLSAEGWTRDEIAAHSSRSVATVKKHIEHVLQRTTDDTLHELVARILRAALEDDQA